MYANASNNSARTEALASQVVSSSVAPVAVPSKNSFKPSFPEAYELLVADPNIDAIKRHFIPMMKGFDLDDADIAYWFVQAYMFRNSATKRQFSLPQARTMSVAYAVIQMAAIAAMIERSVDVKDVHSAMSFVSDFAPFLALKRVIISSASLKTYPLTGIFSMFLLGKVYAKLLLNLREKFGQRSDTIVIANLINVSQTAHVATHGFFQLPEGIDSFHGLVDPSKLNSVVKAHMKNEHFVIDDEFFHESAAAPMDEQMVKAYADIALEETLFIPPAANPETPGTVEAVKGSTIGIGESISYVVNLPKVITEAVDNISEEVSATASDLRMSGESLRGVAAEVKKTVQQTRDDIQVPVEALQNAAKQASGAMSTLSTIWQHFMSVVDFVIQHSGVIAPAAAILLVKTLQYFFGCIPLWVDQLVTMFCLGYGGSQFIGYILKYVAGERDAESKDENAPMHNQMSLEDLIEPIALCYCTMGVGQEHKKDLISTLKSFAQFNTGVKSAYDVVKSFIIKLSSWVSEITGYEDLDLSAAIAADYKVWKSDVRALMVASSNLTIDISHDNMMVMESVIENGLKLQKKYEKTDKPVAQMIGNMLKQLTTIHVKMLAFAAQTSEFRAMPGSIMLFGPSGTGKSELALYYAKQWCERKFADNPMKLKRYRENWRQFIHVRIKDKWMDGVTSDTEVLIYDDLGTFRPSTPDDSEWGELIKTINVVPMAIPSSEADKKGTIFLNNSLTIVTTNQESINDPVMTNHTALHRRLPNVYRVTNSGTVKADKMSLPVFEKGIYQLASCQWKDLTPVQDGTMASVDDIFNKAWRQHNKSKSYQKNNSTAQKPIEKDPITDGIDRSLAEDGIDISEFFDEIDMSKMEPLMDVPSSPPPAYSLGTPKLVNYVPHEPFYREADVEEFTDCSTNAEPENEQTNSVPGKVGTERVIHSNLFAGRFIQKIVNEQVEDQSNKSVEMKFYSGVLGYVQVDRMETTVRHTFALFGHRFVYETYVGLEHGLEWKYILNLPFPFPIPFVNVAWRYALSHTGTYDADNIPVKLTDRWVFEFDTKNYVSMIVNMLGGEKTDMTPHASDEDLIFSVVSADDFVSAFLVSMARVGVDVVTDADKLIRTLLYNEFNRAKRYAKMATDCLIHAKDEILKAATARWALIKAYLKSIGKLGLSKTTIVSQRLRGMWQNIVVRLEVPKLCLESMWNKFYDRVVNPVQVRLKKALQWVLDHKVILASLFTAGTVLYGLYRTFFGGSVSNMEDQSNPTEHRYKDGVPDKSAAAREAKMLRPQVGNASSQYMTAEHLDTIVPTVKKNMWDLYSDIGSGPVRGGTILALYERRFIMPRHFYAAMVDAIDRGVSTTYTIVRGDEEYSLTFDQVKPLVDFRIRRDLLAWEFDNLNFPKQASILKHVARPQDVGSLLQKRLPIVAVLSRNYAHIVDSVPLNAQRVEDDLHVYGLPTATVDMKDREPREKCISYHLPTKRGACGAVVMHNGKVVALHTAGNGVWSAASIFDISEIVETMVVKDQVDIKKFADVYPDVEDITLYGAFTQGYDMEVHSGIPFALLDKKVSDFVKTDLVSYNGFGEPPCEVSRVLADTRPSKYGVAREPYRPREKNIDMEVLAAAGGALIELLKVIPKENGFKPLTLRQAIEGVPEEGIRSLDMHTSVGFPEAANNLTKRVFFTSSQGGVVYGPQFPLLSEEIKEQLSAMQNGFMPIFPFTDFLKSELRAPHKAQKPRLISGSNINHVLICKMMLGRFYSAMNRSVGQHPVCAGMDPINDWDFMHKLLVAKGGTDRFIAGDFKEFDGTASPEIMFAVYDAFERAMGPDGLYGNNAGHAYGKIRLALMEASVYSYHIRGKYIEEWIGGWASGNYSTAHGNSGRSVIAMAYAFIRGLSDANNNRTPGFLDDAARMFTRHVRCYVLGDDNIMAVSRDADWFTGVLVQNYTKELGDVYTSADKKEKIEPFIPIDQVTFLKRSGVYHPDIDRWVGALQLSVILEMVCYTIKGKEMEVIAQRADNALMELSMHPQEVWDRHIQPILSWVGPWFQPRFASRVQQRNYMLENSQFLISGPEHDIKLLIPEHPPPAAENQMASPNDIIPAEDAGVAEVTPSSQQSHNLTTTFADDAIGLEASLSLPTSISNKFFNSQILPETQGIADFMARPSIVASGILASSDTGVIWEAEVTAAFNSLKLDRLTGIYTVKGDFEYTMQVNADRFQAGRYIVGWLPNGGVAKYPTAAYAAYRNMHMANLTTITQLPHVELDLAKMTSVTLKIPYMSTQTSLDYSPSSRTFGIGLGRIFIIPYSPLIPGSGGSTASWTMFSSIQNAVLGAVTAHQMESAERNSVGKGPISSTLGRISRASAIMGEIPLISGPASTVSWLAGVLGRSAATMGWSKPLSLESPARIINQIEPYTANVDGISTAKPLGLSTTNSVVSHNGISGTTADEMSFDFIKSQYAYVRQVNWSTSQIAGTLILEQAVGAVDQTVTAYRRGVTIPPVNFLMRFFKYYRGGFKMRFKMVKTEFPRGRLLIAFSPGDNLSALANFTMTNTEYVYRVIVDVAETSEFEICVPYLLPTPWQLNTKNIGVVRIFVLNQLAAPTSVANYIPILMEICGDKDLAVAVPDIAVDVEPYAPSVAQMAQPYTVTDCVDLGPNRPLPAHQWESETIGESIQSFRALLKRNVIQEFVSGGSVSLSSAQILAYSPYLVSPVVENATTGVLIRNSFYSDIMNTMSCCYAFSTGAVRVGFWALANQSNYGASAYYPPNIAQDNVSIMSPDQVPNSFSSVNHEGVGFFQLPAWNTALARSTVEQMGNLGAGVSTTAAPKGNNTQLRIGYRVSTADTAIQAKLLRSAADDFNLMRWVGVPALVFRSTTG